MSRYRGRGNSQRLHEIIAARIALNKANSAARAPITEEEYISLMSEGESNLPTLKNVNMDQIAELLKVTNKIDLSADPGQAFISHLKSSGKIDKSLLDLAEGYKGVSNLVKTSGQTKYAYQVKVAFTLNEETIAETSDRMGPIKVKLRDNKYIDLSFKEDDVQSRLNTDMPKRPHLKYIQTMLVAPLLIPDDSLNSILIIGLGGGTIPKYYTDFYRNKRKVVVDIRPVLFDIAAEYFDYIPDVNTVKVPGDASQFLSKARVRGDKYDIVNTDIFIEGPSDVQMNNYFWDNIASILTPHGISVSNVWRGDYMDKYEKILNFHKRCFKTVFEIVNSETDQVAMYGSNLPFSMLMHNNLHIKSAEMSGLTAVNFNTHINNIRRLQ